MRKSEERMRSYIRWAFSAVLAILPIAVPAATTPDNFIVRTAGGLAALCSADQNDPMMAAAIGFCEGFAVGVYQTLEETQANLPSRFFCVPTPTPTRSQAIASFVAWVKESPSIASQRPADAILGYLQRTYPCAGAGR
jgi:hypothetical protein